ncbi:hypothetical protein [Anaeromyxobacter sp. Fw109-5]|uniref:hypothetical protein n=1 Tax=Anaeromyxobacter sp. (strain Fw109-5) TaxID=404589 RepID=UPI000158A78A|nr:hypothetical protein [Anaeromyxobacter sp. Fw109-5]ABS25186.1 conserved hypothetical protein [Anaeromyxobacter sp. Fw109-5]
MTDGQDVDAGRRLAQRLLVLEEGPIRARAAARALAAEDPAAAAGLLSALARAADPGARVAMAAVGQALADPDAELPYAWRADLYVAAAERGLDEVTSLLASPPPSRAFPQARDRADARLASLSLGHKKAFARGRGDPDLLARLAAEGEPTVVAELLRNPRLTEPFVVRIAARRPCRPETLRCLFASRWRTRPAVARAIARNPYASPDVALKLVPFLPAPDLHAVAGDFSIHPLVRALAEKLSRARTGGEAPGSGPG